VFFSSDEHRTELLLETGGKGYDLILTSGIDLAIYLQRNLVAPLDLERLPNIRHVSPQWRRAFPNAEQYAVPFFWGTSGVAYREDLITTPITSWMQIFDPGPELQGRIAMLNTSRDVIGMALKALGFSLHCEDEQALEKVRDLLRRQKPHVHSSLYLSMDESSLLVRGDVVAAMAYSGDALMLAEHNDHIRYVIPEEGGNIWVDYFIVARHAVNPELAHAFLNFINEPENAAQMATFVYYATPNLAAEKLLDEEFLNNPIIYPSATSLQNSEFFAPLSPRGQRRWHIIASELMP
jgi:spermidine/putrescine transport system substrate-binding protein